MKDTIRISRLSPSCVTRKRGQEAALKLKESLATDYISIDLTNEELISMSFLDGLVSTIILLGAINKVTFQISDSQLQEKLARLSAIRCTDLYYCYADGKSHKVVPKTTVVPQATFVARKESA